MKLFSTQTHGLLDYLTAGALLVMPRALGWSENATRLLTTAALSTVTYSLLTRYELGAYQVLPMETHLALDAINGLTLATAPLWLDEDETVNTALVAIGLFELMAALSTETQPGQLGWSNGHREAHPSGPVPQYIPIDAGGVDRSHEVTLDTGQTNTSREGVLAD